MAKANAKVKESSRPPAFEAALSRLEEIVVSLESGELTLDESLALFEEGMRLLRVCTRRLDEAETRISMLMRGEDGETKEVLLEAHGNEN